MIPDELFQRGFSAFVAVMLFLLILAFMAEIGLAAKRKRLAQAEERRTIKAVTYTPEMIRELVIADFYAEQGLMAAPDEETERLVLRTQGVARVEIKLMYAEPEESAP